MTKWTIRPMFGRYLVVKTIKKTQLCVGRTDSVIEALYSISRHLEPGDWVHEPSGKFLVLTQSDKEQN